jgi:hypothetical protein
MYINIYNKVKKISLELTIFYFITYIIDYLVMEPQVELQPVLVLH